MAELTQAAIDKLAAFTTELPSLLGYHMTAYAALPGLLNKMTTGESIDPALRDRMIEAVNADPDAAIESARKQIGANPDIIVDANNAPNQVFPVLFGFQAEASPVPVAVPVAAAAVAQPVPPAAALVAGVDYGPAGPPPDASPAPRHVAQTAPPEPEEDQDPDRTQAQRARPAAPAPVPPVSASGAPPSGQPAGRESAPVSATPQTNLDASALYGTPAEQADYFIATYVDPAINEKMATLADPDRAKFKADTDAYREKLRTTITQYESTRVTPEKAANILRQDGATDADMAVFNNAVDKLTVQGLPPRQVAIGAFVAVQKARDNPQNPDKGKFFGTYGGVDSFFYSRIFKAEHGQPGDPPLQRNATMLDYLTRDGVPDGLKIPGYSGTRDEVYLKTSKAAAPPDAAAETAAPASAAAVATPAGGTTVTGIGAGNAGITTVTPGADSQPSPLAAVAAGLGKAKDAIGNAIVTPAYGDDLPDGVQPGMDAPADTGDTAAAVDETQQRADLTGSIMMQTLTMLGRPGMQKLIARAKADPDVAAAITSISGFDLTRADQADQLQAMSTEDLDALDKKLKSVAGIAESMDSTIGDMSPQALNSIAGMVNSGSKLLGGLDNAMGGLENSVGSMFGGGGGFSLDGIMGSLKGLGGLGAMFMQLLSGFTTLLGQMFSGFGGADNIITAGNSGGQQVSDYKEIAALTPDNTFTGTIRSHDANGNPEIRPDRPAQPLPAAAGTQSPDKKPDVGLAAPA